MREIYIKSNGIPTTLGHALDYSLPIDNMREVIEEMDTVTEDISAELDNETERADTVHDKWQSIVEQLQDYTCNLDSEIDSGIEKISSEIASNGKYFCEQGFDTVEFYGDMVMFLDSIVSKIEGE